MTPQNNAITQRLDTVTSLWQGFAENAKGRVCRWVVEPGEVDMISAFVKVENANEAKTNDLFIRFVTPFNDPRNYSESLVEELVEEWKAYQNYLPKNGKPQNWYPDSGSQNKTEPQHFLKNFNSFSRQLPDFEGLAVAFLFPDENEAPAKFEKWIERALHTSIPQNVRLMVIDLINSPCLEAIARAFPEEVISIQPDLDMPSAISQLASAGNPSDPGVQFRKLFIELNQHSSKGNLEEMNKAGEKALALAVREEWMQLQVATYIALAAGYTAKSQTGQALAVYDKARLVAQTAWKAGDPLGGKLLTQTLLGKGSLLLGKEDYPGAGILYKEAVLPATETKDDMGLLEAWRMSGFCHEMNNEYRDAWECNQNALTAGERLDENLRQHCTLPFVGQALLRLTGKLDHYEDENLVRQKMAALCGEHWEEALHGKKVKS